MASCGPPPRAAQHPVLLQFTLLQHPLSSKYNASTSSDILAAASHATAAAILVPGSTSALMKVNVAAIFGQKMSPVWVYFTKSHRRFRPRDDQGKNVMLSASPRRQGESSVHPQRNQGFDATFAHGIILFYKLEAIARNASYERSCF